VEKLKKAIQTRTEDVKTDTPKGALELRQLRKAKYTKRWRGKDGQWHYEYGKGQKKGISEEARGIGRVSKEARSIREGGKPSKDSTTEISEEARQIGKVSKEAKKIREGGKKKVSIKTKDRKSIISILRSAGKNHGVDFSDKELLEMQQNGVTIGDLNNGIEEAEEYGEDAEFIPTSKLIKFAEEETKDRISRETQYSRKRG